MQLGIFARTFATVGAERPVPARIRLAEDVDVAGPVVPGVVGLRDHAAVLAVDLEALVEVHPDGDREIEMPHGAVLELE